MNPAWRDRPGHYGRLSRLLHWSVAALVIALMVLGSLMEWTITFDDESLYVNLKHVHISLGALLVIVLLPRVAWRLRHGWRRVAGRPPLAHWLAVGLQSLLLAMLVAQATTGVLSRWTAAQWRTNMPQSISIFGLLEIPSPWSLAQPELNRTVEGLHDLLADWILVVLALHMSAAAAHAARRLFPRSTLTPSTTVNHPETRTTKPGQA